MKQGLFDLKNPLDLLKKLHYEYEELKKDRLNSFVAFNFFVTAEHMLDWVYPGSTNKKRREQVRRDSVLLQICSHVANGAKHFEVEAKHHVSVSDTSKRVGNPLKSPIFHSPIFHPDVVSGLFLTLDGEAGKKLGVYVNVLSLAKQVLEFWEGYEDLKR